jgi:hypothetical protein
VNIIYEFDKAVRAYNKKAKELNKMMMWRSIKNSDKIEFIDGDGNNLKTKICDEDYTPKIEAIKKELPELKAKIDALEAAATEESEILRKKHYESLTPEQKAEQDRRDLKRALRNYTIGKF